MVETDIAWFAESPLGGVVIDTSDNLCPEITRKQNLVDISPHTKTLHVSRPTNNCPYLFMLLA